MNHLFLTGSKEDNQIINSIVARETRSFGPGRTLGLGIPLTGSRYYVYRGREGHLHRLCFDGSWSYHDLNATIPK